MKKNKKVIAGLIILILLFATTLVVIHSRKTSITSQGASGTVTNVTHKLNQAEDGYYGIEVKGNDGQQYTINATGYLNIPVSPDSLGEVCVEIPEVKVGDKVSYHLPRANAQQNTFDICYKKNLSGYYFSVE